MKHSFALLLHPEAQHQFVLNKTKTMKVLNQEEAIRIAKKYAKDLGIDPFEVDGCDFAEKDERPHWSVFLGFSERYDSGVGLPHSLVIEVDALSGEASHVTAL